MLAMDKSTLYSTAQNFAKKIKEARPDMTSDPDACLCLIVANSQDIFSGVTSIKVDEGNVETFAAEDIAANALIAAGGARAAQMILITLDDNSFMTPSESCLARMMRASVENGACEIIQSPEESVTAASLVTSVATPDFLSGYDDDTPAPEQKESAKVGAPAEFAEGFDVDEGNPFYGGPSAASEIPASQGGAGVNSLYDQPADAQEVGASGFPNPYMTPPLPVWWAIPMVIFSCFHEKLQVHARHQKKRASARLRSYTFVLFVYGRIILFSLPVPSGTSLPFPRRSASPLPPAAPGSRPSCMPAHSSAGETSRNT